MAEGDAIVLNNFKEQLLLGVIDCDTDREDGVCNGIRSIFEHISIVLYFRFFYKFFLFHTI